ncbi:UNVERIFIED_ORG: hypothetical protein LHK14_00360 [Roseateles sp. XES5]|nr:hypothetical protein [Roseateles sp. XES5]
MSAAATELLVVYWEWTEETKHAGHRFWAAHATENDGRLRDWPQTGLRPLGASKVTVTVGEGLDLLASAAAASAPNGGRDDV